MHNLRIEPSQIGFDFDGVIADIGEAFIRLACENYDYCSLKLEDITSFHVETCTRIPESVVRTIFDDILADSVATQLLPIDGALNVIEDLASREKVVIITARSFDQPVIDWLEYHLPGEVCRRIELVAMHDHDQKVRYIRQHDLHYFVDDRAETCAQVAAADLHPLLYRQPWNSSWNDFTTVENWHHISKLVAE